MNPRLQGWRKREGGSTVSALTGPAEGPLGLKVRQTELKRHEGGLVSELGPGIMAAVLELDHIDRRILPEALLKRLDKSAGLGVPSPRVVLLREGHQGRGP